MWDEKPRDSLAARFGIFDFANGSARLVKKKPLGRLTFRTFLSVWKERSVDRFARTFVLRLEVAGGVARLFVFSIARRVQRAEK